MLPRLPGLLIAGGLLAASAAPALAAPAGPWSGAYVGINGGYGFSKVRYPFSGEFSSPGGSGAAEGEARADGEGLVGGVTVGFNRQAGKALLGLEGDFGLADADAAFDERLTLDGTPGWADVHADTTIRTLGTARARLGWAGEKAAVYATGGLAFGKVRTRFGIDVDDAAGTVFSGTAADSASRTGWAAGAGAEFALNERLSLKLEGLHVDLGRSRALEQPFSAFGGTGAARLDVKTRVNLVRVGLNWRFR